VPVICHPYIPPYVMVPQAILRLKTSVCRIFVPGFEERVEPMQMSIGQNLATGSKSDCHVPALFPTAVLCTLMPTKG
jgi:hypothetical protein